jgi:hypothetical protein
MINITQSQTANVRLSYSQ